MRAPEFWSHRTGPEAAPLTRLMLEPASWLYRAGAGLKSIAARGYRAEIPVICIGNITLGGAGKTPMAMAILDRLRKKGIDAHALTRGYRGRRRWPLRVDPEKHDYRAVGDEALLIARVGPTWVARSRVAGAKAAARAGAQALVLDDGFQNHSLQKDLSFVLIDAEAGLGNGRVFPAGPLRETARRALRRADAIVLVGEGEDEGDPRAGWRALAPPTTPVLRARLTPQGPIPGGPVFAFAGIGRPQKFFDALVAAGADLKATATFPDHHPYTKADLNALRDAARRHNALLLTTEKDHVRVLGDLRRLIHAWPVVMRFDDEARLDALIERALDRAEARR